MWCILEQFLNSIKNNLTFLFFFQFKMPNIHHMRCVTGFTPDVTRFMREGSTVTKADNHIQIWENKVSLW